MGNRFHGRARGGCFFLSSRRRHTRFDCDCSSDVCSSDLEARGSSSGIIWRNGVIVTAEHALGRDEDIQLTLPDGRVVTATLTGRDPSTDLAVLKCPEATSPFTETGDVYRTKPGNLALVVGRMRAVGPFVALGAVS